MNAINSYIIDIIEAFRAFLFWGGAIALLVGTFSFVIAIAMWDCESGIKGKSTVKEFYEFCSVIPKRLALLGVIAMLIGTLLPSQTTISVWLS